MKCRACSSKNTRVTCTDHFDDLTKRYIRCLDCGTKFRTVERYEQLKPGPKKGYHRPGIVARGSAPGSAIFTENDILEMRNLHKKGTTLKELSVKYGVGTSYVSKIVN